MKKTLIAAAVAAACAAPVFAQEAAAASDHTFTANVGFVSDYLFRGISQTKGSPALQGGFDYEHASGLYAGTWASSVSWYNDSNPGASKSLEWDVYGGYKGKIGSSDFGYDVGVFQYNYVGTRNEGQVDPNTTEVYGALSWKFLTVKYSQAVSKNFVGWGTADGTVKSRGSNYLELNADYDLGAGWGVNAHIGHQKVKKYDKAGQTGSATSDAVASYTDWNVGVTKDVGFGVVGLTYSDTNAKDACTPNAQAYCWGNYSAGKGRALVSFSKTF